ncbi:hypothetical protein Pst134EB_001289 [Puccinia striiformis f. sp. tritici]|nr:hypothetical protein Pst134EB_001289 [Puccinia striiformis f. sp. tritici]
MSSFFGGLATGKQKTVIKPRKNLPEHTKQYQLKKYADATLGSGNLRSAVTLPEGEDLNEWLAVNTLDFYNQINMLYGTVTEFCTPTECPVMSAGSRSVLSLSFPTQNPISNQHLHSTHAHLFWHSFFLPRYEYHWHDGKEFKKATKVSAPEYVEYLMNWVQGFLDDEKIFPSKIGQEFPKTFKSTIQSIVRRLFRVYAHLYNHHFAQICALGIEAHLNTSYRHFYFFIDEFELIKKDELIPLAELNTSIVNAELAAEDQKSHK